MTACVHPPADRAGRRRGDGGGRRCDDGAGRRSDDGAGRRLDDGAALVVAVALVGVLVAVLLGLGVVVDLLAARQRAADVADLAALAAVSTVLPAEAEACRAAEWVAREHAARLRSCALVDGDIDVVVAVHPRGPWSASIAALLGGAPEPSAQARAGRR